MPLFTFFPGRRALAIALLCFGLVTPAPADGRGSLNSVYRLIAGKTFVDLSHSFGPDSPVWSGFGQAKMSPATDPKTNEPYTIAKDGFRATYYQMVGQYGTHVDPPAHFSENGITMDQIPLKRMILPLIVLDDTPSSRRTRITPSRSLTCALGRKGMGGCRRARSWPCVPTCTRTGTILKDSNAIHSRHGPSKQSSSYTKNVA